MKRFVSTTFVILLFIPGIIAQSKQGILSNIQQFTNDRVLYENPQWSPDGKMIAFTQDGYEGLWIMQKDGSNKKQLSKAIGVGYNYEWSIDSKEILVRDTRWDESKGRLQAIWSIDLNGVTQKLSQDSPYLQPASWSYSSDGSKKAKIIDGQALPSKALSKVDSSSPEYKAQKTQPNFNKSFFVDNEKLYIVDENGSKTLLNDKNTYCAVFSPDGTKIAFNQDDDLCVMNIDGTNRRILAHGFFPTWVNNHQVVFEVTTDDGHDYTSGNIYIVDITGKNYRALTTGRDIKRFPAASPDGNSVVFVNASDGQIYIGDLQ